MSDDEMVVISLNQEGTMSGTRYHTWGNHGRSHPWRVPDLEAEHDEDSNFPDKSVPGWREIGLTTAKLFGLTECTICRKAKFINENVSDLVLVQKMEGDKVQLRIQGVSLTLKVGQAVDLADSIGVNQRSVFTVPKEIKEELGIEQ